MTKQCDDKLCFVQFLHPGKEHHPDKKHYSDGPDKAWNEGDHKRKFLLSPGRCVQNLQNKKVVDTGLVFWGEWEPESEVVAHIERPVAQGPQYLYQPFYVIPPSYEGLLQNTDPFVFGAFLYGNCYQHEYGPTMQVRCLERGSVILFGSCVDGVFVLDTVFVVRDWIDYDRSDYTKLDRDSRVPHGYMEVTLNPLFLSDRDKNSKKGCSSDKSKSYRLYFGATYDEPVNGMFSFFPCQPFKNSNKGFARPIIKDLRTDHLHFSISYQNQGINFNKRTFTLEQVRKFWQCAVKQVRKKGLWLGIQAQMPECR